MASPDWRSDRLPRPSAGSINRREAAATAGESSSINQQLLPPAEQPLGADLRVAVFTALLFVQLSNAAYGVITKVALHGKGGVNPLVFSLFRDALSFPLLESIALAVDGALLPARGDIGRFMCLGIFGMFGNQFCYILGLVYIDAGLASVINLLTPVCAWCFATTIGLDRFSWMQAGGVVCAVGGAMIFVGLFQLGSSSHTPDGSSSSGAGPAADSSTSLTDTLKGSLAVFGSCVTMSIYYILMKPVLKIYPPITVTAWSYFFGAFVMGLVSLMYVPWTKDWKNRIDPFKLCTTELEEADGCPTVGDAWDITQKTWTAIFVAVVVNSVMKYGLTSFANKHVSVTVLAIWGTLVPVFTYAGEALACSLQGKGECAANDLEVQWHSRYFGAIGVLIGLGLVESTNTIPAAT